MRGLRRLVQLALLLVLAACAGAPEPVTLDPAAHGRLTLEGFLEANPDIAARLDRAAAWAVFPDVEDRDGPCVHEGRLFLPGGELRAVRLRCAGAPSAPAGTSGHVLVVLEDAADLERLDQGGIDLANAPVLMVHDELALDGLVADRWILSTPRGGVLFDPWKPATVLEAIPSSEPD